MLVNRELIEVELHGENENFTGLSILLEGNRAAFVLRYCET